MNEARNRSPRRRPPAGRAGARRPESFLSSTRGGGMLVGCAFAILFIATAGSAMTNYAWREAQWEEYRAASRAATAALGARHLGADLTDPNARDVAENRLVALLEALQPGFETDATAVTVTKDTVTGDVVVTTGGTFAVTDLWGGGGSGDVSVQGDEIRVRFESDRYEVAVVMPASGSMNRAIPRVPGGGLLAVQRCDGRTTADADCVVKLDAAKTAMGVVVQVMDESASATTGALMASLIPVGAAVNVADTAGGGSGHTAAKERYVRMLAGGTDNGAALDLSQVLANARAAPDEQGHWVDTFARYGVGDDMGKLQSLKLPADLLAGTDWNLRRTGVDVEVARDGLMTRDWVADDRDFWNGCLMARWGAYWVRGARPAGWTPDDAGNWPVTRDAPGWSAGAPALPGVPVHLSDLPPDAADPHSLFTAFSWPDASISRSPVPSTDPSTWNSTATATQQPADGRSSSADHFLQVAMAMMLDPHPNHLALAGGKSFAATGRVGKNDWRHQYGGGHHGCPDVPLTPLTADFARMQTAIGALRKVPTSTSGYGAGSAWGDPGSFLVRGQVWALRTLSPLWRGVWNVRDPGGDPRPAISCAVGETGNCAARLHKSILLVSDGVSYVGELISPSRTGDTQQARWGDTGTDPERARNPDWQPTSGSGAGDPVCYGQGNHRLSKYHEAWAEDDEDDFNQIFRDAGVPLRSTDDRFSFTSTGRPNRVLDAFDTFLPDPRGTDGQRRWQHAFVLNNRFTPWELFRGPGATRRQQVAADWLMYDRFQFHFDGRPVQLAGHCRLTTPFSVYGSLDEHVLVGADDRGWAYGPVRNAAPFRVDAAPQVHPGNWPRGRDVWGRPILRDTFAQQESLVQGSRYGTPQNTTGSDPGTSDLREAMGARLQGWLLDACWIAGQRGVRINAVYIGHEDRSSNDANGIQVLEDCVDLAGGDPDTHDVWVTPSAEELEDAFRAIFTIRRSLRFVT